MGENFVGEGRVSGCFLRMQHLPLPAFFLCILILNFFGAFPKLKCLYTVICSNRDISRQIFRNYSVPFQLFFFATGPSTYIQSSTTLLHATCMYGSLLSVSGVLLCFCHLLRLYEPTPCYSNSVQFRESRIMTLTRPSTPFFFSSQKSPT